MIVDVEKLVSDYLRDVPAVAAIVARRVVGKTPASTAEPWVRVTLLDAADQAASTAEHLIDSLVQFDCYAGADGGQPEATLLARTVRAALHSMPAVSHSGAVASSVRFTGHARLPDTDFEPARERVVVTAIVWAHALPT